MKLKEIKSLLQKKKKILETFVFGIMEDGLYLSFNNKK